jgi:hypothetical protein
VLQRPRVFRGLGVLGVDPFSTWQISSAWALAVMFLFTASTHFTKTKEDLIAMVPKAFSSPRFLVYFTGVLGGLGCSRAADSGDQELRWTRTRSSACGEVPGERERGEEGEDAPPEAANPAVASGPMQLLFVGMTLWVVLS